MSHEDRLHAELAPSAMGRILKCPGSVVLSEGIEVEASKYAQEGTKAHECAEMHTRKLLFGEPEHDGPWNHEMHRHGREYAKFVHKLIQKFKPDQDIHLETRVRFSQEIWGTGDFFTSRSRDGNEYDILFVDYKYGKKKVAIEDNPQILTYISAFDHTFNPGKKIRKAYSFLYQPRVEGKNYSRADYLGNEIDMWKKRLVNIEEVIQIARKEGPDKYLNAGNRSHCWFCPAKSRCRAYADAGRKELLEGMDSE